MTVTNCEEALPSAWQLQIRAHQWYLRNFLRLSLMAWRQPEAQHDAAEFLEYILPRFTWFPSLFSWSARLWVGDELQRETHQAVHLLHLNAPDGLISSSLQDTINAWHQQHQLHALDSAPSKLALQLSRFRQNSNGQYVKHGIPINLRSPISLPVFRSDQRTECSWSAYVIQAALIHIGPNMQAGHYRAALIDSGPSDGLIWYTDDNRAATSVNLSDVGLNDEISTNCYVLYCQATSSGARRGRD